MPVLLRRGHYQPDEGTVTIDGAVARLTSLERRLLDHLVARPTEVVAYSELLVEVWDAHPLGSIRPIEATLARLRRRLGESGREPVHLHTEHGTGLRFVPARPQPAPSLPTDPPTDDDGATPLGGPPLPPEQAIDWLRHHAELDVPLRSLVAQVGGSPVVLQRLARLGPTLTPAVIRHLAPLEWATPEATIADALGAAWERLSAAQQATLQALSAFTAPLQPPQLALALDAPLIEVLTDLQQLITAGWLYKTELGFGVDAVAAGWLATAPGRDEALRRHRDLVTAADDLPSRLRWAQELQQVYRRFPEHPRPQPLPGEAWLVHVLGADPVHPVDAALLEAVALFTMGRLDQAVDTFHRLPPPDDDALRLRWSIVGCELADHEGDLAWFEEVHALGRDGLPTAPPLARHQHYCTELKLRHHLGLDLTPTLQLALASVRSLDTTDPAAFAEGTYLHLAFQQHPTEALCARLRALAQPDRYSRGRLAAFLLSAERELQLPLTLAEEEVIALVPPTDGLAEQHTSFLLHLALASLPDVAEATRLLALAPAAQHADNRLARALLQRLLFDDDDGLRAFGGEALVARVGALRRGEAQALPGYGWGTLRHALRLPLTAH